MTAVQGHSTVLAGMAELKVQREKLGFWMHFATYLLINGMLATMNLLYAPHGIFFIFVLFPWGIGIVAHFIGAYYTVPLRLREQALGTAAQAPSAPPPSA